MIEEIDAMAGALSIDPARFLHEHLAQASPDLLRSLLTTMIDTLSRLRPTRSAAPATANAARRG
jgi:hypothetical protein